MRQITEISESSKDLHEEEEESESETETEDEGGLGHTLESQACNQPVFQMTMEMQRMVKNLQDGVQPQDDGTETILDAELNKLSYCDFESLCKAQGQVEGQDA